MPAPFWGKRCERQRQKQVAALLATMPTTTQGFKPTSNNAFYQALSPAPRLFNENPLMNLALGKLIS